MPAKTFIPPARSDAQSPHRPAVVLSVQLMPGEPWTRCARQLSRVPAIGEHILVTKDEQPCVCRVETVLHHADSAGAEIWARKVASTWLEFVAGVECQASPARPKISRRAGGRAKSKSKRK